MDYKQVLCWQEHEQSQTNFASDIRDKHFSFSEQMQSIIWALLLGVVARGGHGHEQTAVQCSVYNM